MRRGQIRTAVSAQRPCRMRGRDPSTMFHQRLDRLAFDGEVAEGADLNRVDDLSQLNG